MKGGINKIEEVRKQIIDTSLVVASLLGVLAYLLSLSRIFKTGFQASFIIELAVLAALITITLIRASLSNQLKTFVIISLILIFCLSDAINYGMFSSARVYLILIPFFSIFYISFARTLLFYASAIGSFLLIGLLHHRGVLSLPETYEPDIYVFRIYPWIINAVHISVVAIIILLVTMRFVKTYSLLIADLEISNKAISESERNYREIFNSSTDAIFIHNLEGDILDVNHSMLVMYGYSEDEKGRLTIENLSENLPPYTKAEANQYLHQAREGSRPLFDWHARKKEGMLFWVEVSMKLANIGGQERILVLVRDISEKKLTAIELENYRIRLELLVKERTEELESANEELKATNEELYNQRHELETTLESLQATQKQLIQSEKMASLGVLAAGVAHEINNPLNFIYGGIVGLENYLHDHLKDHIGALTPMLEGIQTGARRAADIVTSLNHYSRYDDAPMAPCNIHSIIDNCLIMLSSELKYRIEIKKEYAEAYGVVPGNESKLHQAILNIIANAGQSIEDKGTIAIETRPEDSRLIIEISDSGCGISEENLPRITDPFFTTKDPGKGTGLGLSIAYNIIREHGGTLEFESQVGKGTKAILVLPAGSPG